MRDSVKREVVLLSEFRHPNIIRLLGYHLPDSFNSVFRTSTSSESNSASYPCLVYELASKGSLDSHLSDDERALQLPWMLRLSILSGIANALNYLHCRDRSHPAYHRDIKSAQAHRLRARQVRSGGVRGLCPVLQEVSE